MAEVIELEGGNVSKHFGGLAAVKNVDFEVRKGEILGLIGPNGAGKTTLLSVISGFYRPDSGQIRFRGKDITGLKPHEICRRGIARTFQLVKPLNRMTVLENAMVGAFLRTGDADKARKEASEWLNFTGLLPKRDHLAGGLTIADRKRLEIGRALATRPKLLLLDEVVAGLNPREANEAIELMRKINDRGFTLIIVEHVMKFIMSLSDRIIVLHHGAKIAEGKPKEIANNQAVIDAYLGEAYA